MNLTTLKKTITAKVLLLALPLVTLLGVAAPSARADDHHRGRHFRHHNRPQYRHHYRHYYRHHRHHYGYWRYHHGHRYWYENGGYYASPGGLSISIGL